MNYEIKINKFNNIQSPELFANNSFRGQSQESLFLPLSNYFCNKSYITLFLTDSDKKYLRAMEKILLVPDNQEDIVSSLTKTMNVIHKTWSSFLNSVLYVHRAINKLKELNPNLGKKTETWLGFDTSKDKSSDAFSFIYLRKEARPLICLMIGKNIGLLATITDVSYNMILNSYPEQEYHPVLLDRIISPIPNYQNQFIKNNGTVKSLMVSEFLTYYYLDPGVGNFHKTSVMSAFNYLTNHLSGREQMLH